MCLSAFMAWKTNHAQGRVHEAKSYERRHWDEAHQRQASSLPLLIELSIFQHGSTGRSPFRNEKRPTDKKILLWTKRFRREEDIPPLLSVEVLKTAHNQLRIQICYLMIALTLLGCVTMVISGKLAAKREDTLLKINTEKKAMWRMERQKEQERMEGSKE
uniref:Family with sequence similarity 162 member A n=1 Tax=Anolis carolinensis TaxID=28377 RepID=A0A803TA38_ANOCA